MNLGTRSYVAPTAVVAACVSLASTTWAQLESVVTPVSSVPSGQPALDALFTIGLGLLATIGVLIVGHSYWAYQRARRRPLQDSEDAVRNLGSKG